MHDSIKDLRSYETISRKTAEVIARKNLTTSKRQEAAKERGVGQNPPGAKPP